MSPAPGMRQGRGRTTTRFGRSGQWCGSGHPALGERCDLQLCVALAPCSARNSTAFAARGSASASLGRRAPRRSARCPRRRRKRDVDAILLQLERRGVGERPDAEAASCPQATSGHGPSGGATRDLDHGRRATLLEQEGARRREKSKGCAGGQDGPGLERIRCRLAEQAAAEWPATVAAIRGSRVHDQVDATVRVGGLLEGALHARPVGDVSLESQCTGGRDALQSPLRTGNTHDSPSR
jgi:hypothetical protein